MITFVVVNSLLQECVRDPRGGQLIESPSSHHLKKLEKGNIIKSKSSAKTMIIAGEDNDDDEVPCLVQVEKAIILDDTNYCMTKIPVTILVGFLGSGYYRFCSN